MLKANGQSRLKQINVTTERLNVRPFVTADVSPTYLSWLNDGEHMRFSNQRFETHTHDSALEYLSSFKGFDSVFLAIELRDLAQLEGTATVFANVHHGTADIGVMVGSDEPELLANPVSPVGHCEDDNAARTISFTVHIHSATLA